MMPQGQLVQTQQPLAFGFLHARAATVNGSSLGNRSMQISTNLADSNSLGDAFRAMLIPAQPAVRLALLKRQKFTPEGREQRIEASLAALNAAQPTELTLAQWKELLEEAEDED